MSAKDASKKPADTSVVKDIVPAAGITPAHYGFFSVGFAFHSFSV